MVVHSETLGPAVAIFFQISNLVFSLSEIYSPPASSPKSVRPYSSNSSPTASPSPSRSGCSTSSSGQPTHSTKSFQSVHSASTPPNASTTATTAAPSTASSPPSVSAPGNPPLSAASSSFSNNAVLRTSLPPRSDVASGTPLPPRKDPVRLIDPSALRRVSNCLSSSTDSTLIDKPPTWTPLNPTSTAILDDSGLMSPFYAGIDPTSDSLLDFSDISDDSPRAADNSDDTNGLVHQED
ncbi:hypothetical protein PtB15_16B23 [Puccinia triticina]|nr:hypothetical protein PtB15_16B23 [Puccinia triticina]